MLTVLPKYSTFDLLSDLLINTAKCIFVVRCLLKSLIMPIVLPESFISSIISTELNCLIFYLILIKSGSILESLNSILITSCGLLR